MKYDKRNITAMVTGMVIGAALVSEAAAGIVAEPTWQKIYVDGRQVSMTAYNIAGSNIVFICSEISSVCILQCDCYAFCG